VREIVLEARRPVVHRAGWLPIRLAVPVINPGVRIERQDSCRIDSALHLVSTWPHMHQIGIEFHAAISRAAGGVDPLVDIAPWSFDTQRAYPLDVDVHAGDAISTQCIWQNTTSMPVLPGPRTTDEMCNPPWIASAALEPVRRSSSPRPRISCAIDEDDTSITSDASVPSMTIALQAHGVAMPSATKATKEKVTRRARGLCLVE
jgi:hypothetical protein